MKDLLTRSSAVKQGSFNAALLRLYFWKISVDDPPWWKGETCQRPRLQQSLVEQPYIQGNGRGKSGDSANAQGPRDRRAGESGYKESK
jgi:hypothetical protein